MFVYWSGTVMVRGARAAGSSLHRLDPVEGIAQQAGYCFAPHHPALPRVTPRHPAPPCAAPLYTARPSAASALPSTGRSTAAWCSGLCSAQASAASSPSTSRWWSMCSRTATRSGPLSLSVSVCLCLSVSVCLCLCFSLFRARALSLSLSLSLARALSLPVCVVCARCVRLGSGRQRTLRLRLCSVLPGRVH